MPKLKSTEVSGKVDHQHKITIMRIGDDGTQKLEEFQGAKTMEAVVVKKEAAPMTVPDNHPGIGPAMNGGFGE
jgi:hypothetical protein